LSTADSSWQLPPSPDELRVPFDAGPRYAIGIEDEVMLLDPGTLELSDRAGEVLAMLGGDRRYKLELPASQLEIMTSPCRTVRDAAAALLESRRDLVAAVQGTVSLAAAGVHPFSAGAGTLNTGTRYDPIVREYRCVANRELVCALQVHVSVGDSARALAVYNAARAYLPLLAALAANAPFYEGADTGLASVRPKLAELLPRQGVPPRIASWESYHETLAWGQTSGAFRDPASWWWELRLHPGFGTLEFRVPDAQSAVGDAAAVAALAQALVAWLGARHDAGEQLEAEPSWRIDENRWSACRDGVDGEMADLRTGVRRPTRTCLSELLNALGPTAKELGCEAELDRAHRLGEVGGASAQRAVAREAGVLGLARWLSERFLDPLPG
jgi:carboxylate-amine ligase